MTDITADLPRFSAPLVDTHCHLTADHFTADREAMIARIRAAGIIRVICIGTGMMDVRKVVALADAHPDLISVSAGIDPFSAHQAGDGFADELAELDALLASGRCCALGEIGLDYHYELDPHPVQQQKFHQQLDCAEKHALPVVIHVREAHPDMIRILGEHPRVRGVIHSFTGGPQEAEAYLGLGWHLAYNGVATFKNAQAVRDAALLTPNDRLLVETDAPYLAPVPRRGKRNEPALITHTAAFIADLRGERHDDVAAWTTRNAARLFRLPDTWQDGKLDLSDAAEAYWREQENGG